MNVPNKQERFITQNLNGSPSTNIIVNWAHSLVIKKTNCRKYGPWYFYFSVGLVTFFTLGEKIWCFDPRDPSNWGWDTYVDFQLDAYVLLESKSTYFIYRPVNRQYLLQLDTYILQKQCALDIAMLIGRHLD